MENTYYATSDFGFACFLKSQGIDFREIKKVDNAQDRLEFVFRIRPDSEELETLEQNWRASEKAAQTKRTLYASKLLRTALKEYHANAY